MTAAISKLQGRLVRLRALDMDDLDRYVAWMNDADVTRWLGGTTRFPFPRLAEAAWLEARVRETPNYENLALAIETLEGRHIGSVGLDEVQTDSRRATLGIMIGDKDYWNHAYGTDTVMTMLRFAFDEMNLNKVGLSVREDNERAIACYHKCGFVEEGRLRQDSYREGRYMDSLLMGVLASEFRARQPREETPT